MYMITNSTSKHLLGISFHTYSFLPSYRHIPLLTILFTRQTTNHEQAEPKRSFTLGPPGHAAESVTFFKVETAMEEALYRCLHQVLAISPSPCADMVLHTRWKSFTSWPSLPLSSPRVPTWIGIRNGKFLSPNHQRAEIKTDGVEKNTGKRMDKLEKDYPPRQCSSHLMQRLVSAARDGWSFCRRIRTPF
ncbi:4672_t:CDS:1 [Paraglomus occultum]|uniref:4672_t:CDS:1 n=1 Tax=Paraglomus occultum TaxID=144539 RepID=A0A9N9CNV5_9GLOM|nr:4672_t:CDS:1 [Paraglomus occultum]